MARERLQKILSAAGVASRRECEHVILDGRVRVNGKQVLSLPVLVDPAADRITLDGKPLVPERKSYYVLHKPKGVHCTNFDPDQRRRAVDLLAGVKERLFPVGRLDADSTGLLLMTNDGELAERVAHPRYGVPKTYRAHVGGRITKEDLAMLHEGVWLAEGKASVSQARIIHAGRDRSVVEVTLREGRNREVRRVLAKLSHPVRKLIRIQIGPISLRGLAAGEYRRLTSAEIKALRDAGGDVPSRQTHGRRRPPKRTKVRPRVAPPASGGTADARRAPAPKKGTARTTTRFAKKHTQRRPRRR
ncbi:MAG: rRNA pseudouridine synthase [Phycisphaerae bacterium]|nr:rRNA pseudouridine synthase [Phycisphaerae bacterium]